MECHLAGVYVGNPIMIAWNSCLDSASTSAQIVRVEVVVRGLVFNHNEVGVTTPVVDGAFSVYYVNLVL
jgi:hypothetical protein